MQARYHRIAIVLHWLIGVALVAQTTVGLWMLTLPKTPPGLRAGWFNLHKSTGITLGLLIVLRLAWRLAHRPPALPAWVPRWQATLAMLTHLLLYVCMLGLPLSGIVGSSFSKYPIRYFGIALPRWGWDWPEMKEAMSGVHQVLAWTLIALVALHVLGALRHALARDGLLARMGIGRA